MANLTCTVIQTSLQWEDKEANLESLSQKIQSIKEPAQIVILPEMFSTGFSMKPEVFAETMDGPSVLWMKQQAAARKIILTGSLMIEEEGRFYNRLIWMLPNGNYGYYDKRHLFGYAGETEHYTPGNKRFIASVNGWKVHLLVCYDLRFPVWSRQQPNETQPEFDLLIYVANWPERRNHAWKTLLQARAIENQCYVIGVNRVGKDGNGIEHCGDSMIIDPLGMPLFHNTGDECLHTETLKKEVLEEVRTKYPFWKDADAFALITTKDNKPE